MITLDAGAADIGWRQPSRQASNEKIPSLMNDEMVLEPADSGKSKKQLCDAESLRFVTGP
jgi:hypothetical protein